MSVDWTATLPRKRIGAGVLLRDQRERVLLVEPTYKSHWEVPGGCVEADESPRAAAGRELREELGLSVPVGRLLVTDWVPARDGRTEGLMLIFDGGVLSAEETAGIRVPAEELRGWAWCTAAEAGERLLPLLARRIAAAVRVLPAGGCAYLEDGYEAA
ncbi:NUDIX domain-containing protein [Actinoplanes italicus]|uniref:NUDIX domain-containing protein n=1 Tax=Actinoplanes italicus TaxID=113567 RepID=UPI001EF17FA4|nr:NUDIX hydrolase [Actinoplanes italicus]